MYSGLRACLAIRNNRSLALLIVTKHPSLGLIVLSSSWLRELKSRHAFTGKATECTRPCFEEVRLSLPGRRSFMPRTCLRISCASVRDYLARESAYGYADVLGRGS